jgi:peptidoglycan/LPS O-acetylase OafA/YrhL
MAWSDRHQLGQVLSTPHLPALDGLRAIAVGMVVVAHAGWPGMPGDVGVSVFFVLSGFLITWLLLQERDRTGSVSLRTFYLRRAFRLLPAYYVFLAFALLAHFRAGGRADIVLPSLLYYANYYNAFHGHVATPVSHTWSLAVEEQFYAFWPLAFLICARLGRRAVITFLCAAIVAVTAWRSYLFLVARTGTPYVYNAFDTRFDTLAIGCLAALLSESDRFLAIVKSAARHWSFVLPTVVLIWLSRMALPDDYHYSIGLTIDALLIALGLFQLMQLTHTRAWSWLDSRAARYLGGISYPMYLYSGFALTIALKIGRRLPAPIARPAQIAAAFGAAALLGAASYHVVEKPMLRVRDRLIARLRARSGTSGGPARDRSAA